MRQQDALLTAIVQSSGDAIIGTDLAGAVVSWNPAAQVLLGRSSEETIDQPLETMVAESRLDAFRATLTRITRGGQAEHIETALVRKDGVRIEVSVTVSPIRNATGELIGTSAIARKLPESERIYRAIGESIDYGVWICAPDGRNIYASESFLKLVGLTQEQCSNYGWGSVLHPDDSERTIAAWKECTRTGTFWDIEHRFRGVDGQWHPILARGVPVKNEQGEIICWAGINLDISHLKQTEASLRESEERERCRATELQALLDAVPAAVFMTHDPACLRIDGNRACYELIRLPPNSNLSTTAIDAEKPTNFTAMKNGVEIPPEELPVQAAAAKGIEIRDYEFDLVFGDGSVRHLFGNATPLRGPGEKTSGAVGAFVDITERKRLQEERERLLEREKHSAEIRYRKIVETAAEGIWLLDAHSRTTFVNPAMAAMLGYRSEEMIGHSQHEYLIDDVWPEPRQGAPMRQECRLRHRTGSEVWVLLSVTPLEGESGKDAGELAMAANITDRKQAEMALRVREEQLNGFFETSPAGMFVMDREFRWMRINQALAADNGAPVEQHIGKAMHELLPALAERVEPIFRKVLETGESMLNVEVSGETLRDPGSLMYWVASYFPITGKDSQIVALGGVVVDITERKRTEQSLKKTADELARSNAELEQFAYVTSHDLREPLRMIANYAQLLEKRYKGQLDPSADKYIGYIVEGVLRMQDLIADLLAYSRVRQTELSPEAVDMNEGLRDALRALAASIEETHASITHDPLPVLRANPFLMQQLLQNFVGNAVKFHREGVAPEIHVSAAYHDGEWVFSVSDNGIGIEPQYADRIFVIFQRLHNRSEYRGTGIGLAICKNIVERYGGKIWLHSKLGQGTTFYFTLPVATPLTPEKARGM